MKAAVFAFSRQGCRTARRVLGCLEEGQGYTMARFEEEGFQPIPRPSRAFYGGLFQKMDALIFVGSTGIAVREIAPHVRDKSTDPAVLVIDELGHFVIPLLSGHIGGANALARQLAEELDATPVITTATDIHSRFSVDAWAARNGFALSSLKEAKAVSAEILERDVPLYSDFPIAGPLPGGVMPGNIGEIGISISICQDEPFRRTLRVIPPIVHLGIGCRKGVPAAAIEEAVDGVLKQHRIDPRAVVCAASIDLKAEEPGLLEFCRERKLLVRFYPAETLKAVRGAFTPSEFVQSVTGVDNVCERAALIGAKKLIIKKTVRNGVTVAAAEEDLEVRFG